MAVATKLENESWFVIWNFSTRAKDKPKTTFACEKTSFRMAYTSGRSIYNTYDETELTMEITDGKGNNNHLCVFLSCCMCQTIPKIILSLIRTPYHSEINCFKILYD